MWKDLPDVYHFFAGGVEQKLYNGKVYIDFVLL